MASRFSLVLYRWLVRFCKVMAPLAKMTGVYQFRVGRTTLGQWMYSVINTTLMPQRRLIDTGLGFRIYSDAPDSVTNRLLLTGRYELGTTILMRKVLKSGMVFVDIGAHIGYYTLLASTLVGREGKVFAFEPEEQNYKLLSRNIELNRFRNAVAIRQAVFNRARSVRMMLDGKSTHHFVVEGDDRSSQVIDVMATTLDDFFARQGWSPVDLIKIDVEGAELSVLEGMVALLERNPQAKLVLELSPGNLTRAGVNLVELPNWLQAEGFSLQIIDEGTKGLHPYSEDKWPLADDGPYPFVNLFCQRLS